MARPRSEPDDMEAGGDYEADGSVAETIEKASGIDLGNEGVQVPAVQSTTKTAPREADKTPMPNKLETEPAVPVATQRPDEPIAQTLAAGAGEHTPPDPDKFDKEGRPRPEDS